jgi:hypothetical protein
MINDIKSEPCGLGTVMSRSQFNRLIDLMYAQQVVTRSCKGLNL